MAARKDATCLAGARAAGARIVGRTNLNELAFGVSGVNPWYGTPRNPLDAALVPGGSSSGSAVAVATGEADVGYGTDTGRWMPIPSACCGTAGLKTTWGHVSVEGVRALAPSLDTVGPMACDVQGLVTGMQLLEPGFVPASTVPARVGRLRLECDPLIADAMDRALGASGWEVVDVDPRVGRGQPILRAAPSRRSVGNRPRPGRAQPRQTQQGGAGPPARAATSSGRRSTTLWLLANAGVAGSARCSKTSHCWQRQRSQFSLPFWRRQRICCHRVLGAPSR